ncbi:MAG TPA: ankyrin repeat domain-containing protein, partial [Myxococcota bacterium]|nr:ankyrin repeat domain-containing protein [Myxococcota bacterium]
MTSIKSPSTSALQPPVSEGAAPAGEGPSALPENVKASLLRAQRRYQIRRAHAEYGEARGFDMRAASHVNFAQVRQNLRTGLTAPSSAAAGTPPVAEAKPGDTLLTHLEGEAFAFILENLSLRHASASFSACDGTLLSLKQRERTGVVNERHTPTILHDDDNVFFVLGLGDHATPRFLLGSHTMEVYTLPLEKAYAKRPELLEGLWVGPHYTRIIQSFQQPRLDLEGAGFELCMDKETETTRFVYSRRGEPVQERVQSLKDMILIGDEVGPGIAFRLLEHLRHIGDPYRTHLLQTLADPATPQEHKLQVANVAMSSLMAGEVYPEAKVPVSVPLDQELGSVVPVPQDRSWTRLQVRTHRSGRPKYKYVDESVDLCIRAGDLGGLEKIVKAVDWKSVRSADLYARVFAQYDPEPEGMALLHRAVRGDLGWKPKPGVGDKLLDLLVKHGVTAFGDDFTPDALDLAMKYHATPAQIDKLLGATFEHPCDPSIKVRAATAHIDHLEAAVGRPGLLEVFARHGARLEPHARALLREYLDGVYQRSETDCIDPAPLGPEFSLLLDRGGLPADPSGAFGVLQRLIVANDPEAFARILARAGVPPDAAAAMGHRGTAYHPDGTTLLHLAAAHGRPEILRHTIAHGCAVDGRNELGYSSVDRATLQLHALRHKLAGDPLGAPQRALIERHISKIEQCRRILIAAGATPSPADLTTKTTSAHSVSVRVVVTGR